MILSSLLPDSLYTLSVNSCKLCASYSFLRSALLRHPHRKGQVQDPSLSGPCNCCCCRLSSGNLPVLPVGVPEVSFCKWSKQTAKSRLLSMAYDPTSAVLASVISCLIKYFCPRYFLFQQCWSIYGARQVWLSAHATCTFVCGALRAEGLFDFMLCCNCVGILHNLWSGGPEFSFDTGLCKFYSWSWCPNITLLPSSLSCMSSSLCLAHTSLHLHLMCSS